jgi:alanine racemase
MAEPHAAGFDPWLEIDPAAFHHNAREITRLAGRRILAVTKNNAYGLGIAAAGPILDSIPEVAGLATVKVAEALALRAAGVRKPILLMGAFDHDEGVELVRQDVQLTPFGEQIEERLTRIASASKRTVRLHIDIDTGMNRSGIPYTRALEVITRLAAHDDLIFDGAYTTFAERDSFDAEQQQRFMNVVEGARARGIELGTLHAMSSHSLFFFRNAPLDLVRPGLVLYGAYPAGARSLALADLKPVFRLCARVLRVEQLQPGEGVSYGREYVAQRPTWIATLPVGHADGYPRTAVKGCEVLIAGKLYPVIGAVSASHTIIELGASPGAAVGDLAILVGPDADAILPNTVAERAGIEVYDVLMHLNL